MTLEEYYGEKLQMLRNGQQYLSDMIAQYPVEKTADGRYADADDAGDSRLPAGIFQAK